MTKSQQYIPILKTTSAELKGLRELSGSVKDQITPIFELTRSRKTKAFSEGDINQQLDHVTSDFPGRAFILDLTGHPNRRNTQIKELQKSANGYEEWTTFVAKKQLSIPRLIPTLQINDEDVETSGEFYKRLCKQVKTLGSKFETIAYRLPLGYEDTVAELTQIKSEITPDRLIAILDAGFIPQNKADVYAVSALNDIQCLVDQGIKTISIAGSSFPQNPVQYGNEDEGEFNLEEVLFYNKVQKKTKQKLIYGDYGTIHPEPSLQAGGRGWVSRIDLPCETSIIYRRSRKSKTEKTYANAYSRVGVEIEGLSEFSTIGSLTGECWGIEQIQMAADGLPPALSPSHWISARINIHINVRLATM